MTDRTLEQSLANVRALTGTYAADLNDHYYSDCKVVFDSAERLKELEAENEELLQYKLAVNYLTTKAAEHGVVTLKELLEKLERELADIKAKNELLQGQLELKNLEFIRMENAWRGEVKYYQRLYEDGYVDE